MTLRIGNKGLTLIEVMLTVSLLSLATVMIYQANILSLGVYGRYSHRLGLQSWAEEKIWESKQSILESENPEAGESSGSFQHLGRDYDWKSETNLIWESEDKKIYFYDVRLTISWEEDGKPAFLYRSAHLQKIRP